MTPATTIRHWNIGSTKITQIVEFVLPEGLPGLLPDATPEAILAIPWLRPDLVTARGDLTLSLHAFVIETPTKRILVDTCIGDDKDLAIAPMWSRLSTGFLRRLEEAGFPPGAIDVVVCTHLHLDHVGWNTRLVDGAWRPTFPRARYLFGRIEHEHLETVLASPETDPAWRETNDAVFRQSIEPIFAAGLAELVELDHPVTDEVALRPATGHTPGHVAVVVRSAGAAAIITGDAIHHPCQLVHPEWCANADEDPAASRATRWSMLRDAAAHRHLVLGTHWPGPGGGYIVADGAAFRLE